MIKYMVLLLAASAALIARADTLTYFITVDTSSQVANPGTIDFQLNPGTLTPVEPVTATIQSFAGAVLDGTSVVRTGDTTGTLSGTVTLNNDVSPGAEYTENITNFGATVSFYLTLSGSGVDQTGNAGGASGTAFVLDFTDFPATQYLFTNDPNGVAAEIDVAADGTVSTSANPGPCTHGSCVTITPMTSSVPEPSSVVLLGGGFLALWLAAYRKWRTP
jgi:hypothetical protein